MIAQAPIRLTTSVLEIPGVGSRRAQAFRKLGIRCVADLILHLPLRYEHDLQEQTVAAAGEAVGPNHNAQANIAVRGEIGAVRSVRARRSRVEATLEDGTGTLKLTWFNAPWLREKLSPGAFVRVAGKARRYGDYLQMVNPQLEPLDPAESLDLRLEEIRPIYPASESLSSGVIRQALDAVLEPVLATLEDHLHEEYRGERALPALADAYRMVHRPDNDDEVKEGRRRLAFDELLMMQLAVFLKRHHRRDALKAPALKHNKSIDAHILARFPFKLTKAQRSVVDDLAGDLRQTRPMNRLLQGDVGAGKTVVALYGMLMAVASQHQAALMAPTELLAEQHFASITSMLKGARVRIELLTGSQKAPARKAIHKQVEAGEIDILVGTHALLTETVKFKSLALAVIDEQHRFGVHQRATLRAKSTDPQSTPHILVMTATPIPRTLSLTLFGDLDISTIRQLPPGRSPIITRVVTPAKSGEVYSYVAERLSAGDQAYIVVPTIDDSESGLRDLKSHIQWLSKGPLAGRKLAALHGRLPREEREEIMSRFRAGKLHALVATTVIEVGVDVPNASIMIVENADRFGLAQLHQLRGRVGRGSRKSLCVLIGEPVTDDGKARLEAIASSTDGFEIAEKDLEIRGPGDLFGSRQSGLAPLRAAELPRDLQLLQMARRDARQWIEQNPMLEGKRDALLRKRLLKAHGEMLGLGDVA